MKPPTMYMIALLIALGLVIGHGLAKTTGKPAKPLTIAKWVKAGPVNLSDGKGKNVYLIEFFATWCPPCRESIPHLTALQKKYKDQGLVVVGVSDEAPEDVKAFVKAQGDQMDYAVAVDRDDKTTKDYMIAYGLNTIPTAFLIDRNGAIAWYGYPLDEGMETVLAKLLKTPKTGTEKPAL